jgi:hypothetical protein
MKQYGSPIGGGKKKTQAAEIRYQQVQNESGAGGLRNR